MRRSRCSTRRDGNDARKSWASARRRAPEADSISPAHAALRAVQIAGRGTGNDGGGSSRSNSASAPTSSTSTWAARPRRSAASWRVRHCSKTKISCDEFWTRSLRCQQFRSLSKSEPAGIRNIETACESHSWRRAPVSQYARSSTEEQELAVTKEKPSTKPFVTSSAKSASPYSQTVISTLLKKQWPYSNRTKVDGIMIGRGAQGRPWLFNQVSKFITENVRVPVPSLDTLRDIILSHLGRDLPILWGTNRSSGRQKSI